MLKKASFSIDKIIKVWYSNLRIGDAFMKKYFKLIFISILFCFTVNVDASPANDSFIDDNLYKCIIDAYNANSSDKKDYSYNILPEELNTITNLDCSKYRGSIENLTGLDKLVNLTKLNLSGNTFLGGSLKINGPSGTLKSNIILPSGLTLTDVNYSAENPKIVKITKGVVYPLSIGSTYVTMTAKVSGNEIKEKYLVSVVGDGTVKSSNAKLASLYLSEGEFAFNSDVKTYTVILNSSVKSVKINANVLDKKASFVSGYGPRTVELKTGTNTLLVKVKAEDGTINTYTISVIRSDGSDLNNRLINIELSVGKIDFKPDVYIYNFTVASNVDEIDVKAVTESSLAKAEVSDTKLKVGINKITIKVTSESGSPVNYDLIVTREDYDSPDNYLKSLTIKDYEINFDRNVFNYNINIGSEKSLIITPVCEKSDATYSIVGNANLKNDSKIIIKVSDKEGSTREYTINVKKSFDLSFLSSIEFKWVFLILEFITIIVLLLVIIFKGGNKPRRPKKVKKVKRVDSRPVKVNANVCKACGTVNDMKSKTCYVCGNLLK